MARSLLKIPLDSMHFGIKYGSAHINRAGTAELGKGVILTLCIFHLYKSQNKRMGLRLVSAGQLACIRHHPGQVTAWLPSKPMVDHNFDRSWALLSEFVAQNRFFECFERYGRLKSLIFCSAPLTQIVFFLFGTVGSLAQIVFIFTWL